MQPSSEITPGAEPPPGRLAKIRPVFRTAGLAAVWIAAFLLALWIYNRVFPGPQPLSDRDVAEIVQSAIASATPAPAFSADVYNIILPSLVYIETSSGEHVGGGRSIGSGVVIGPAGEILTAYHVVDDADKIEIYFADGSSTTAQVLASEPENDIAVLLPDSLPGLVVPAVLGNPNAMRIGDEAYAVGNPLGLVASMSAGVISGFNRTVPIQETGVVLEGLIQFDTAVNPGSSGGPLLNRAGQVIGIVTALANPSEQNFFVGVGFAVSIMTAASAAGVPGY